MDRRCGAVYGRLDVNVALNRPAYQSSVYYQAANGYFEAWKGVDGDNNTVAQMVGNSCVWTLWQTHPWWAVDLGAAVAVLGVLLTSRAENYGNLAPVASCSYKCG